VVLRSEAFDSFVQVFGSEPDDALASNDDGFPEGLDSRLQFVAPVTGTYVLRVQSLGGDEVGAYELTLTELPPAPPAPEPRAIRLGQTLSGDLDGDDPITTDGRPFEAFTFRAREGDRLAIAMTSSDVDSFVEVGQDRGGAFEVLASNDDDPRGSTLDSRVVFAVPQTGAYVIRAMPLVAGSAGAFDVSLQEGPAPIQSQPLTVGADPTDGELSDTDARNAGDQVIDSYGFALRSGQRVEVTADSSDFDTYISVFDEQDNLVGEDDDGGFEGTNSRLVIVAEQDATYRVEVRAFSEGSFGSYSVAVKEVLPPPPPTPLAFGQTVEHEITDSDPLNDDGRRYDGYSFSGVAGQRVQITMRSGDFDSYLEIGKAGDTFEVLGSDDDGLREGVDSRLNFTLPDDGDYVVRAMPLGTEADGLYSLELVDKGPRPNPGSLLIGTTARGQLTDADSMDDSGTYYDDWTFQAKEDEELELIMVSNELDSMVSVGRLGDDGEFRALASDDDGLVDVHAKLEWTVPDDGIYVVRAQSFAPNQTGAYALIITRKD
jgi:hypothetical protein